MNLQDYYETVRDVAAKLKGEDIVIVSLSTVEGGKPGQFTETPRAIAARMIAEGRARAATGKEAEAFREKLRAAKEKHDQEEAAGRMRFVMVPQPPAAAPEVKLPKERS